VDPAATIASESPTKQRTQSALPPPRQAAESAIPVRQHRTVARLLRSMRSPERIGTDSRASNQACLSSLRLGPMRPGTPKSGQNRREQPHGCSRQAFGSGSPLLQPWLTQDVDREGQNFFFLLGHPTRRPNEIQPAHKQAARSAGREWPARSSGSLSPRLRVWRSAGRRDLWHPVDRRGLGSEQARLGAGKLEVTCLCGRRQCTFKAVAITVT